MATFIAINQMEFVDQMFAAARKFGVLARINRNGDRQLDFDNKSLTEDHIRRLYQDIVNKLGVYSRVDFENLLGAGRPCAVAPFFDLATKAGLAVRFEEQGKVIYRFKLSDRVA
jgi:hypothetical protein